MAQCNVCSRTFAIKIAGPREEEPEQLASAWFLFQQQTIDYGKKEFRDGLDTFEKYFEGK